MKLLTSTSKEFADCGFQSSLPEWHGAVMQQVYAMGHDLTRCIADELVYPIERFRIGIGPMLDSEGLDWSFVHAVTHVHVPMGPVSLASVIPHIQQMCKEIGRPFLPTPFTLESPPPPGFAFVEHETPTVDLTVEDYLGSLTAKRRYKVKQAMDAYEDVMFEHLHQLPEHLIQWCVDNSVDRWREQGEWGVATAVAQPLFAYAAATHGFNVSWIVAHRRGTVLAVLGFLERDYDGKPFALYHSFTCNAALQEKGELKDIGLACLGHAVDLLKGEGYVGINVTGFTAWDNPPYNVYKYAVCNSTMPVYTTAVLDKPADFHPPYYLDGEHTE